eukprot:4140374-Amphidinium_carterae.1
MEGDETIGLHRLMNGSETQFLIPAEVMQQYLSADIMNTVWLDHSIGLFRDPSTRRSNTNHFTIRAIAATQSMTRTIYNFSVWPMSSTMLRRFTWIKTERHMTMGKTQGWKPILTLPVQTTGASQRATCTMVCRPLARGSLASA